jgi:uncharacterized metal-binding protein
VPSGRTHLAIELGLLGFYAIPLLLLVRAGHIAPWAAAAFAVSYLFSSVLLSPDLDLARSRPARRWRAGRFLWFPYALVFRHRGLSHHLLLGPLTRIAYLGALLAFLLWGAGLLTQEIRVPRWTVLVPVLVGLYLPNQVHIVMDRLRTRRR